MSVAGRNWADLPSDIVCSISQLLKVSDYFRFRAVCSWWDSESAPPCIRSPPEMPFLLLLGEGDDGDNDDCCTLVRFSDPDRRPRSMGPIPEMRGKWLLGSQNGWIGLLDEHSEVTFLNPLTRVQIRLPSVTTVARVKPIYDDTGTTLLAYHYAVGRNSMEEYNSLNFFRGGSFKKIVLSSTPVAYHCAPIYDDTGTTLLAYHCAAMAIFGDIRFPAFAAEGSGKWELLDSFPNLYDIIYHDGKFLALAIDGGLWFLDPTSPPRMKMIAQGYRPGDDTEKYLVDCSGDLLQVWKGFDIGGPYEPDFVKLLKFNPKQAEWVPFRNLGDYSLFLGLSYSISLSSRDVPEMKPNCIYFTEILWDWVNDEAPCAKARKLRTRALFVFNLEDESFDHYHPPDDRLNWPPPLWYTPSLR